MYWRKNDKPVVEPEAIAVWECLEENCRGWMRKNFALDAEPKCPLCKSDMESGERLLQKI
ncbi:cold-inducible protein YdjO-related protein [Bacillus sp. FSL M8-0063]|uniref:Cold-shock protein n=1 Tax=Bacillus wiedmannii TaxID=1890302 RepID=A0A1A9PU55_9BACI|nr:MULTISPECIES: cold-inducible protein YdjO-related protein [Bacillus]OUB83639.1 cold-shock protein [Bacillus thuringiensis serovar sinensis]KAA0787343.1 cold-shock protein [Bacillus sp. BPN334]MBG9829761.1 cold-shock protein [Bacillus wiedmannii]MBY7109365.1 cold-shock protein [Bacillus sp. 17RED48]MBY7122825.1 cold-shock protein [Bacillus sp. 16GRE42]